MVERLIDDYAIIYCQRIFEYLLIIKSHKDHAINWICNMKNLNYIYLKFT